MDTNKIQQLILQSELSEEAKNLILKLLPYADQEKVKKEIIEIMAFEEKMATLSAQEASALNNHFALAISQLDSIEDISDKQINVILESVQEKIASIESSLNISEESTNTSEQIIDVQDQLAQLG